MSCRLDKNLLYSYIDGSIEPLERIFVEEHLKYCTGCRNEIEMMKLVDTGIRAALDSIRIPDRLSFLSEMVAENCISTVEEGNKKVRRHNFFQDMKSIGKVIIGSQRAMYSNPYNTFIGKSVKKTVKVVEKPIAGYLSKKMQKVSLLRILKVG